MLNLNGTEILFTKQLEKQVEELKKITNKEKEKNDKDQ